MQILRVSLCRMLMPALFEGAMGRACFKGESFARVKRAVPPDTWSIMDEISEVRQRWHYQPSMARRAVQASIRNPFIFQYLMRRGLAGKIGRVVKDDLPEDWQSCALSLAECLWEQLCASATT